VHLFYQEYNYRSGGVFPLGGGTATSVGTPNQFTSLNKGKPECQRFSATKDGARNNRQQMASFVTDLIKDREGWNEVDEFFDCILVKIEGNDTAAKNKRQFRGHIIVTLLARYGAFNITGEIGQVRKIDFTQYSENQEDAVTLLAHIKVAEGLLRTASTINDLPKPTNSTSAAFAAAPIAAKLHRIFAVLQIAIDAEAPTLRRIKGFVRSLISAAATRGTTSLKRAGTDALSSLRKVAVLNIFASVLKGRHQRHVWAWLGSD